MRGQLVKTEEQLDTTRSLKRRKYRTRVSPQVYCVHLCREELDRRLVEVEQLRKEKESREGGLEGLVKGMERKLELKEMVIKVGLDSQTFREFSL